MILLCGCTTRAPSPSSIVSMSCCFSSAATLLLYHRRRLPLPLLGGPSSCIFNLGLTNHNDIFSPSQSSSSSSFKTGCAQSLSFFPFSRSRRSSSTAKAGIHSPGSSMEPNTTIVPIIVVYVTVPNKEAGKKLAESIVQERLAACVNRVPGIESVYQWQGKIQTDSEELLIIKTKESLLKALTEHVKTNHEYDVPEVIAMPVKGGSLQYLEWIKESTRD